MVDYLRILLYTHYISSTTISGEIMKQLSGVLLFLFLSTTAFSAPWNGPWDGPWDGNGYRFVCEAQGKGQLVDNYDSARSWWPGDWNDNGDWGPGGQCSGNDNWDNGGDWYDDGPDNWNGPWGSSRKNGRYFARGNNLRNTRSNALNKCFNCNSTCRVRCYNNNNYDNNGNGGWGWGW